MVVVVVCMCVLCVRVYVCACVCVCLCVCKGVRTDKNISANCSCNTSVIPTMEFCD